MELTDEDRRDLYLGRERATWIERHGSPCEKCGGGGVYNYPSTATWRGGVGGHAFTRDVCDQCWGSGIAERPWPSHRDAQTGGR